MNKQKNENFSNSVRVLLFSVLAFHVLLFLVGAEVIKPTNEYISISLNFLFEKFGREDKKGLFSKVLVFILSLISVIVSKEKPILKADKKILLLQSIFGILLFFGSSFIVSKFFVAIYVLATVTGFLLFYLAFLKFSKIFSTNLGGDTFNKEKESFLQFDKEINTDISFNYPTTYIHKGKYRTGYINIVNPFRHTLVTGTAGSGKTFSTFIPAMWQAVEKGFSVYVYDYKFPSLAQTLYTAANYYKKPNFSFYVINFDDARKSHRNNPMSISYLNSVLDAQEIANTLYIAMNGGSLGKDGSSKFFDSSAVNFITCCIWFLRQMEVELKLPVCNIPFLIELISLDYQKLFTYIILEQSLENRMSPYISTFVSGAKNQLEGQIGTAKNNIVNLESQEVYWVTTGGQFTLDINNPEEPKYLVIGNNPARAQTYSPIIALYQTRLTQLVNQKGKIKSILFLDEFPTTSINRFDDFIATCRSNKSGVYIGIQDFSQINDAYGKGVADKIIGNVGNFICGVQNFESAEKISKIVGKINQEKQSISINDSGYSISLSEDLKEGIQPSKISQLSQGEFVGKVVDNEDTNIDIKPFFSKIDFNNPKLNYLLNTEELKIPPFNNITDLDILHNYDEIKKNFLQFCTILDYKTYDSINTNPKFKKTFDAINGNK